MTSDAPFAAELETATLSDATANFSKQGEAIGKTKGRKPKTNSKEGDAHDAVVPPKKRKAKGESHVAPSEPVPSGSSGAKKPRRPTKATKAIEEPFLNMESRRIMKNISQNDKNTKKGGPFYAFWEKIQ